MNIDFNRSELYARPKVDLGKGRYVFNARLVETKNCMMHIERVDPHLPIGKDGKYYFNDYIECALDGSLSKAYNADTKGIFSPNSFLENKINGTNSPALALNQHTRVTTNAGESKLTHPNIEFKVNRELADLARRLSNENMEKAAQARARAAELLAKIPDETAATVRNSSTQ